MKLRSVKLRYWIALAVAVLVAVVAAGGAVLFETRAGLQWAVARVESFSNGAVTIGTARGRLAGPLTLEHLHVTLSSGTLEAKTLAVDWHPWALITGRLAVTTLRGNGVKVSARSAATASGGLPTRLHLPLHITVESARFENLTLNTTRGALRLDRLAFSLDAGDREIRLYRFETRGPRLALGGTLRVRPRGTWPIHARLAVLLRPPGYPTVGGNTRLDGALRSTLRIEQTLKVPFRATLHARVTRLFNTPRTHGTLQLLHLDPHAIRSAWPEMNAGADIAFDGSLDDFTAHGTLEPAPLLARQLAFELKAGVGAGRVRIDRLELAIAGTPARLSVHGTLGIDAPHATDVTLAWRDLRWPVAGKTPLATAARGGAQITGTLAQWRVSARTLLTPRDMPQGRWALEAQGDSGEIKLSALAGEWLGGTLAGHGSLSLAAGHRFAFSGRARNLQPQSAASRLKGRVGFEFAATGRLTPFKADARLSKFGGRLQGRPVSGKADLAYAGATLTVHTLELAAGKNSLSAQGRWGRRTDLSWRLRAPQLAALGYGLGGALDADGRIEGPADGPRITATVDGTKLHWRNLDIARTRARASIDLDPRATSSFELHVDGLERGGFTIDRLDAALTGPRSDQKILLSVRSNQGDIELAGQGRLERERWVGQLTSGEIHPAQGPGFTLAGPARLALGAGRLDVAGNCWQGPGRARFCLSAASGAQGWKARLELRQLPLAAANPYLENELAIDGTLNGYLEAAGGNGTLHAITEIHAGHGTVTRSVAGKPQRLAFREAALEARVDGGQVTARLGALLADGGMVDATADIPWESHARPSGRLHLVAHLPDLSGLGALSNAVSDVSGRMDADIGVSGTLQSPRFKGEVRLSNTGLTLTRFGTRIRNGELALRGQGTGLRLEGTLADAGNGRLEVRGTLRHPNNRWALDAHVAGKDFRAADMPEAKVSVSPDFDISVQGYAVKLTGSVAIPSARIRPPHFSNAISPSPDLVIVGRERNRSGPPWTLTTQLHITLGDDVHFNGYGLTARVGGELTINDTPGKLTTASGELKIVKGQYTAYGQDLEIQRGRLLFSGGPVANPGLDIRAARTVGLVTAGLQITGTLRNPRLQVFSDPPMSRSDALAYMLFGHGMQQTSGSEQSTVNRAANAIGIAGGTYLVKSLGKHVGIDTVSVQNASPYDTSANQASLFLGKYLSPRLYVSYGIGLYQPINLLRIRYTLSRHWALEAESGTFSGADILFNIEH